MTNVIKVAFIRNNQPHGREYTYRTPVPVEIGDRVDIDGKDGISQAIVTQVNVPVREIACFGDRAKSIIGKTTPLCEECGEFTPIGEGDHICGADPLRMPVSDYIPTEDDLWCGGSKFVRQ